MVRGIAAWLLLVSGCAWAHESLPAYLEIAEQRNHLYRVLWRTPAVEGAPPAIAFATPAGCRTVSEDEGPPMPGSVTRAFTMECPGGLNGRKIEIAGLPLTLLDVLVRIRRADGSQVSRILRPAEPGFSIGEEAGSRWQYIRLGITHILYGIDHLFFVLGLLLIVRGARPLLKTISAFTLAHTLTLGLAALGFVRLAPAPVEAVIALSIVFLGSELALYQRGSEGLTYRHPWVVAFAFGLLHGFGFAGTLSRLGIPRPEIPMALLLFNCGVELGQVAFVLAFLAFVHSLRDLELRWPKWAQQGVPYAFGATSAYWFIQRCVTLI
jgi:hydrogenase/urease accessory protein HupE